MTAEAIPTYDEAKIAYRSAYDAAYRVSGSREAAHGVALGTALQIASAQGAAAERDRIRQLAQEHNAQCCHSDGSGGPFTDLLDGTP